MPSETVTPILKTTGVLSVAIGGVTAVLTPGDLNDWLGVLSSYTPILMCGLLLWWVWRIDKHHSDCRRKVEGLTEHVTSLRVQVALLGSGVKYRTEE